MSEHSVEKDAHCGHPNHGADGHDCGPFLSMKSLRVELAEALAADLADHPQLCGHSSDPMCCPYVNFPTLAAFFVEAEKPLTSTSGFDPWEARDS